MEENTIDDKIPPRSYTEQKESRRYVVLTLDSEILGIWGNLKKLCTELKIQDTEFPSYWTLTRKTDKPIKFTTPKGQYVLSIEKPK